MQVLTALTYLQTITHTRGHYVHQLPRWAYFQWPWGNSWYFQFFPEYESVWIWIYHYDNYKGNEVFLTAFPDRSIYQNAS